MKNVYISVVTPVYKCAECLDELYTRLIASLHSITNNFEIIMVDDGSPDNAWQIITSLATKDKRVKGIKLSRNFGQHYAITAGLDCAKGRWVVVMDCDLQDQPEEILKLYNKAMEGYDIVVGRRAERKDGIFKRLSSKVFYILYSYFTETKIEDNLSSLCIFSSKVKNNLIQMKEHSRAYLFLLMWVGFRRVIIPINHSHRKYGKSSYNFKKSLELFINIITAHSNKPLRLFINIGFFISCFAFLYGLWILILYFFYAKPILGWASIIVSIFFLGGVIIAGLGMLGIYIGKIFDEVKDRPLYIIEEIINK